MDDKAETLEAVLKEAVDLVLKQSISYLCFLFSFSIFTGFSLIICFLGVCVTLILSLGWFRFWVCDELEISIAGERAA